MLIRSIYLENVLSHEKSEMPMSPLTVWRGQNGSGKSTIVAALQALFVGTADCTDDRGAGLRELIRAGCDKAIIAADVEDGEVRKLRASITEKSGRTPSCSKDSDAGYTGRDYLNALALKKDVLACLINSKTFFAKKEADQKELLASIILPATVEFEAWVWQAVAECQLQVRRDLKPFDLIAECYDAAYKERTAVNRAIKDWTAPEKPEPAQMAVADIRTRLQERQNQRTETAMRRNTILGQWQNNQTARAGLANKLEALEVKLRTEHGRREEAAKALLGATAVKNLEKEAGYAEKAAALDKAVAVRSGEIETLNAQLTAVWDLCKEDDAKCPTCRQAIPEAIAEALYLPIQQQFDAKNVAQRADFEERKRFGDPAKAAKSLADHKAAEKQVALIDSHIAEGEKDIAEVKNQMATSTSATQPDTSAIDAELTEFDRRIEMGNGALQAAIQSESKQKYYDQQNELKARWTKTQETLEKLVTYFGKDGVQAKLLAQGVGPFEKSMNAVLAGWGFECRLGFEPYAFDVRFVGKERWYSLKTISASQRAMFAVAFQVALAKTTAIGFVVVDAADIFLDANRSQLYRNLMGAKLEQIIVLQSDTRREIPPVQDAVFYALSLDTSADVPRTIIEKL